MKASTNVRYHNYSCNYNPYKNAKIRLKPGLEAGFWRHESKNGKKYEVQRQVVCDGQQALHFIQKT